MMKEEHKYSPNIVTWALAWHGSIHGIINAPFLIVSTPNQPLNPPSLKLKMLFGAWAGYAIT